METGYSPNERFQKPTIRLADLTFNLPHSGLFQKHVFLKYMKKVVQIGVILYNWTPDRTIYALTSLTD